MSTEKNKALVRREWDVLNSHDLTSIDAFFNENCAAGWRYHGPRLPSQEPMLGSIIAAFPDLHFTVEDLLAVDDKFICRYSWRGTHHGEFMGIAPTGKQMTSSGIVIYRLADGKYAEIWEEWDVFGFLQRLGAAPTPVPVQP